MNRPIFSGIDSSGKFVKGSDCHQQSSGQLPVCVVTDLKGKILIGNTLDRKDRWSIVKARASITRLWTSSNAFFQCAIQKTDFDTPYPPLTGVTPDEMPYREYIKEDGAKPAVPLYLNDEICIYMGYIESLRPVTTQDLRQNKLLRVFVGVVDIISGSGTVNAGDTILVNCRDRMKYLMDSLASYNTADFDDQFSTNELAKITVDNQTDPSKEDSFSADSISRPAIILGLARRAIGHLEGSPTLGGEGDTNISAACKSVCGLEFNAGKVLSLTELSEEKIYSIYDQSDTAKEPRFVGGTVINKAINNSGLASVDNLDLAPLGKTLTFNIISGRDSYQNASSSACGGNFQVTDKVPIEYIKYLALQEPWVAEVFQDHRTGEFWYAPRGLDLTGFDDPLRFNRTYFYKTGYQDGKQTPHPAQMCRVIREEASSLNWRSNTIVTSKPATGNSENSSYNVHLKVTPPWLENRKFACTYYFINEPTAQARSAELAVTALAYARNYSKELTYAYMNILGDPSLVPGEAVSLIGSVLNTNYNPFELVTADRIPQWQSDRNRIKEYYTSSKKYTLTAIEANKAQTDDPNKTEEQNEGDKFTAKLENTEFFTGVAGEVSVNTRPPEAAARVMCDIPFTSAPNSGKNINKFTPPQDIKTVWRVDAVTHRFNDGETGFFTEASLFTPVV